MNIQDLQSSLQGYNQSVAEGVDKISDKIGDIRSNIQEGMSVPLIAGGLTGGLREGGKISTKAGKKLVGVADRLKGRSQMTSNLDENTGAVFKSNPNDFRIQEPLSAREQMLQDNSDAIFKRNPTSVINSNNSTVRNPLTNSNEVDAVKNVGSDTTDLEKTGSNIAKKSVETATEGRDTTEGIVRGLGEGLMDVGETQIPIISEIGDIGAGIVGGYELIKGALQGEKIKQEERAKEQMLSNTPNAQDITGGNQAQNIANTEGGTLNF